MKLTLTIFIAFAFLSLKSQESVYMDSLINAHISNVEKDSLFSYVYDLQNFGSRHALNENRKEVAQWIKRKFESFGIEEVRLDSFQLDYFGTSTWQYNVIATIPGKNTSSIYVIGGHHDSTASIDSAPGADDNASGTAATLEIARSISQLDFMPENTYKFMTFAAEELGLHGSEHIAKNARENNEDIKLMINNDMIGYSNSTSWKTEIQPYSGAQYFADLANRFFDKYTLVDGIPGDINASNSDSYSFHKYDYPAVFFIEYTFSPVYHTYSDLIDTMNFEYLTENVNLSYALLLKCSESPQKVQDFIALDKGNGTGIVLNWFSNIESDIMGYVIKYSNNDSLIDSLFVQSSPYEIEGLTFDNEYFFEIAAIDNNENIGVYAQSKETPLIMPRTPQTGNISVTREEIIITWNQNTERDLKGYNLYRTDISGANPELVNESVLLDTFYVDNLVEDGDTYYYFISAIDDDNNESDLSAKMVGSLVSFSEGILIVDDSRGGIGNPSENEVDNFYEELFSNYEFTHHDISQDGDLSIVDFGKYSSVVWHINNKLVDKPFLYESKDELKKYLDLGGNLLLTLNDATYSIDWNRNELKEFVEGDFIYDYLKIEKSENKPYALFNEAISNSNNYLNIYVDSLKTLEANQYHFNGVEAIYPTVNGESIFTYGTDFGDSSIEKGEFDGLTVGIEYLGNDFQVITLSFPLYYMNVFRAQEFIDQVFENKFDKNVSIENIGHYIESSIDFEVFPNPSKGNGTIRLNQEVRESVSIDILSSCGHLVQKVFAGNLNSGNHDFTYNIENYLNGLYFIRVMKNGEVETKKLLKIN